MKRLITLFVFASLLHADKLLSRFEGNGYAREALVIDDGHL